MPECCQKFRNRVNLFAVSVCSTVLEVWQEVCSEIALYLITNGQKLL